MDFAGIFADGDPVFIIGTLLGWMNVTLSLFIYVSNRRDRILILKLCSDLLSASNMFMCGFRVAGAFACSAAILRESLFLCRTRYKWADHRYWMFAIMGLMALSPAVDFAARGSFDPLSLLPAAGSLIAAAGLFSRRTLTLKILMFVSCIPYLLYNLLIYTSGAVSVSLNVPGMVGAAIPMVSTSIGIVHEFVRKPENAPDKKENE